jgi:hypothetical protein
LDLGHRSASVASRAAAAAGQSLSSFGHSVGAGVRHAAKHKGGFGGGFLRPKAAAAAAQAQAQANRGTSATAAADADSECVKECAVLFFW